MINKNDDNQFDNSQDLQDENYTYKRKGRKSFAVVTALVLVCVLALNVGFSVLANSGLWFADFNISRYTHMSDTLYRPSELFIDTIKTEAIPVIDQINEEKAAQGEEPIKINIIFCAEPDYLTDDDHMRYVYYSARGLEEEFPDHVEVSYVNMTKNPSAVQKYKITSSTSIYPSDVIIEFGSEYAVRSLKSFFMVDSDTNEFWAYDGEKAFTASILSVTRAESPICAVTTNHGEDFYDKDGNVNPEYETFYKIIEGAGYIVQPINLETDEIPEDCRMIITLNPKEDFKAFGNLSEDGISEIEKLDKYLDTSCSFFYICDRDTRALTNLEEYLEEWGVTVARAENLAGEEINYALQDPTNSLDGGFGDVFLGNYALEGGGASITEDMRAVGYSPKVVFGNSTAIIPSETYSKTYNVPDPTLDPDGTPYTSYTYGKNGVYRYMYDVFTTFESGQALIDGEVYEMASSENMFKTMTITQEYRQVQQDNYSSVNQASYVVALSSTDFLSNEVLNSSAYGNADVLLSTLRNTSREVIPVDIEFEAFYVHDIEPAFVNGSDVVVWVTLLVAVPALTVFVLGVVVTVKRKYK